MLQTLLIAKRTENIKQKRRYEVGLEKLASSSQQVAIMQAELTELMPKLIQTVAEVEKMMAVVEKEKVEKVSCGLTCKCLTTRFEVIVYPGLLI